MSGQIKAERLFPRKHQRPSNEEGARDDSGDIKASPCTTSIVGKKAPKRKRCEFLDSSLPDGRSVKAILRWNWLDSWSFVTHFPRCERQPSFNIRGSKGGKFCYDHREADMVNVVNKTCQHVGCLKVNENTVVRVLMYYINWLYAQFEMRAQSSVLL